MISQQHLLFLYWILIWQGDTCLSSGRRLLKNCTKVGVLSGGGFICFHYGEAVKLVVYTDAFSRITAFSCISGTHTVQGDHIYLRCATRRPRCLCRPFDTDSCTTWPSLNFSHYSHCGFSMRGSCLVVLRLPPNWPHPREKGNVPWTTRFSAWLKLK